MNDIIFITILILCLVVISFQLGRLYQLDKDHRFIQKLFSDVERRLDKLEEVTK